MPEITSISDNQTLNKRDSVSLNCTADGYPKPSVTWTKVSDNSPVSFPLTITGKENEGLYRCTVNNGIGSPVTKEVNIIVHREYWNVDISDSYTVVLTCTDEKGILLLFTLDSLQWLYSLSYLTAVV